MFKKRRIFKHEPKKTLDVDEVFLDSVKISGQEFRWEHRLKSHISSAPMRLIWGLSLVLFVFFGIRLIYLSFVEGKDLRAVSSGNYIKEVWQRSSRGVIYSSDLKPLVNNSSTFNLVLIPAELSRDKKDQEFILSFLQETFLKSKTEIEQLFIDINRFSFRPVPLFVDVSRDQLLAYESLKDKLPGLELEENFKREYIYGTYYSHLLGYTGLVSKDDLKENSNYLLTDLTGKSGLEYVYEQDLRGVHGKDEIEINSRGEEERALSSSPALAGKNLVLFIDAGLQEKLTDVMARQLSSLGLRRGAAVAIDPRSGGILAMQSFPLYDNNIFSSSISQANYEGLFENKNRPLFNRVIAGLYPPGSTIKPFIGSAALSENIISPDTTVNVIAHLTVAGQEFRDWKLHGVVDIERALAVSSNVFFYTVGGGHGDIEGLGPYLIKKYLSLFGFDSLSGVDLPGEQAGLIPDPNWKKETQKEKWYIGDTYNTSIGQGYVLVTPLGLASAVGAIANNGTLLKPRLVKEIVSPETGERESISPEIIRKNIISPVDLDVIRNGMRRAITEGSAWALTSLPVRAAGKTGTAQNRKDQAPHAWFTTFAPIENPEIVLVVLLENGAGGTTVAVPVANEVLNYYFNR